MTREEEGGSDELLADDGPLVFQGVRARRFEGEPAS